MTSAADESAANRPALVRWPEQAGWRAALAGSGVASLLLVEPGAAIPSLATGEDWTYRSADERDVAARLAALARTERRPATVPVVPVLPGGLSADEHRVAARLMGSPGALVRTEDLGVEDAASIIVSLRQALGPLGCCVHAVGDAGYLLEDTARST